jgi:phospholipid transport system substrate-binding protein
MASLLGRLVPALALAVALAPPAAASSPTDQLRGQVDRVIKTLEDPQLKRAGKTAERRKAVRRLAEQIFDFGETAKRSLGRHWQARTPAEREEFVQLFTDLLERSYISKIELFNGERVTYVGETVDGDIATVRTRIITKQNTEVPVDYRMLKRGDRWLAYDVIIEGVSLIANYRTQFNKIIQTSSYQELIKKMKSKQEEFLEQERKRT